MVRFDGVFCSAFLLFGGGAGVVLVSVGWLGCVCGVLCSLSFENNR